MEMVLLTALGVGGATVIGAVIGFIFKNISHKFSDITLSFAAGVMLAAASGCENVGGLGDLFHRVVGGDTAEDIRALRGSLLHTHISNPAFEPRTRWYPLDASEYDYKGFIEAVGYAGCPRCSIEAGCDDFAATAPITLKLLRSL